MNTQMISISRIVIILLTSLALVECRPTSQKSSSTIDDTGSPDGDSVSNETFVSANNGEFILDNEPFYFVGTNSYHLPNYEKLDPSVVDNSLEAFENAGITVVRMWGFYDGPPQYGNDITLQPEPGVYSEENLVHLDNVIAKGKEHNIRFIVTLVNYWPQLGGIAQYNEWDGNSGGGMAHFIDDPDTQEWFKGYIKMLLNRVNTVTGTAYKNEPAIFSWEIINEGRLPDSDPAILRDWYQEIAQYIKNIDSNHMVSTGEEGFDHSSMGEFTNDGSYNNPYYSSDQYSNSYVLRANEGTSYVLNTEIPEIDYGTAHWYPSEYGWGTSIDQDMINAQHAWIDDHINIAASVKKPFVLGEYGYPGWGDQETLTIYNDLWDYSESQKLDGSLIWQFTPTGTKCYEYGGNICWPGGRQDEKLYNSFRSYIKEMKSIN